MECISIVLKVSLGILCHMKECFDPEFIAVLPLTLVYNSNEPRGSDLKVFRSLSTNGPSMESLDSRTGFEQGTDRGMSLGRRVVSDAYDEKQSSTEKCSGSSRGSSGTRLRWKPNANQIELLERTFEKGLRRATPELHSAIQGCGHATEHNVNVWLKNRTSRHKKVQSKV